MIHRDLVGIDSYEDRGCLHYRDPVLALTVDLGVVGVSFDLDECGGPVWDGTWSMSMSCLLIPLWRSSPSSSSGGLT